MSAADGAKLDAIALVAERLERLASGSRKPEHVFCNALDVAREIRSVLAFKAPKQTESERELLANVHVESERASLELGLWAQRYAESVPVDALIGVMLAEVSVLHLDAGLSREDHVRRCGMVWEVIEAARLELSQATGLPVAAVKASGE